MREGTLIPKSSEAPPYPAQRAPDLVNFQLILNPLSRTLSDHHSLTCFRMTLRSSIPDLIARVVALAAAATHAYVFRIANSQVFGST